MSNFIEIVSDNYAVVSLITVFVSILATLLTYIAKNKIDVQSMNRENKEISDAVKKVQFVFDVDEKKLIKKVLTKM